MGKHKTDRTAGHYAVDEQANRAMEQHNFDKLVAQGTIVEAGLQKVDDPQRYPACYSHYSLRHFYEFYESQVKSLIQETNE